LPPAAFQSYSGVLAGTPACSTPVPKLHVVCVSHCWLQADHPDPRGHNLRILARALRLLDAHVYGPRPQRMGRWAVFMDLCCIHQNCRDSKGVPQQRTYQRLEGSDKFADGAIGRFDSENVLFKEALGSLGSFYSHPCTYVFMLTKFPEDYQTAAYTHSGNTEQYFNRGWCYCESSWAVLTKPSDLTLNLGLSTGDEISYSKLVEVCSAERKPPVFPDAFEVELQRKAFTNGKDDRPRVAELYRDAFAKRLQYSQRLLFRNLQWDDEHMKQLVTALAASGAGPNLQLLDLRGNRAGDEGAARLAEAFRAPGAFPKLRELNLSENQLGAAGAAHLAEAFRAPGAFPELCELNLSENQIGAAGAEKMARALQASGTLPKLEILLLDGNGIGNVGALHLKNVLLAPEAVPRLQRLTLRGNMIGKRTRIELKGCGLGRLPVRWSFRWQFDDSD